MPKNHANGQYELSLVIENAGLAVEQRLHSNNAVEVRSIREVSGGIVSRLYSNGQLEVVEVREV